MYGLLTLVQKQFLHLRMQFNYILVRINSKDHPVTSYISLCPPRTDFLDYFYIFRIWTKKGPTFSSFSDPPTGKKTGPQMKKDAHGASLHIRFLSKCHFRYCIYHNFRTFWSKPIFLKYCHILMILCISDSNMGDPKLLLFQSMEFFFQD